MEASEQISVEWPPEGNNDLKAIFYELTNEFGLPDVDFRSGSRSFKVHKKVLEKHSSVIKAKLSDVWQTSGDVLQLNEEYVVPEVVEELLTWMYYKSANKNRDDSIENAYSLCIAADYLLISDLVTSCCDILRENLTSEYFYDFFKLSNRLKLDSLRQACDDSIVNMSRDYFLSYEIVAWTVEDLKMLIERLLKAQDRPGTRETILLSLPIWISSCLDRFRELDSLLNFVPPETLSSDALFRFMGSKLYSKLDGSRRKQYYVRSYLPTGVSSTDKLYCMRPTDARAFYRFHCFDLSAEEKWSNFKPEYFTQSSAVHPVLGASWRGKLYFLGTSWADSHRFIKVFSTETDKWCCSEQLNEYRRHMLAAVALNDYIYVTDSSDLYLSGKSVNRYCIQTKQWEAVKDMQAARLKHQLVALNGFVYAIGGEVHFKSIRASRPERYDPQTERWEYIAPSHYRHKLPAAVAHEGQIYVLSKAGFETYSPETDQWTQLPAPDVCIKPSLVSIAGRLWQLTDWTHCQTLNFKVSRLVYEFDVVKQEWTRLPDLPEGDYTDFAFVQKTIN